MSLEGWILAPLVALVAVGLVTVQLRRDVSTLTIVATTLFVLYLWGVASQTLFPIEIGTGEPSDLSGSWATINLIPLHGLFDGYTGRLQALLNVVLGLPFGFLVPVLGVRSRRRVLGLGLLFTVSIEGLQFVENWAYGRQHRTVDVNDVMLNWIGVAIGYAGFRLVAVAAGRWVPRPRGGVPGL